MTARAPRRRSIRTRLIIATTSLVLAIVGTVMWQWARGTARVITSERREAAEALTSSLARAWYGHVYDQNWSQLNVSLTLLLRDERSIVYAFVHDTRHDGRIVGSAPRGLEDHFVPDFVRLEVTRRNLIEGPSRFANAFLLRALEHPPGNRRGELGDPILEVATDMRDSDGARVGVLRVGISLAEIDRAVRASVQRVLVIGLVALLAALLASIEIARRISRPLRLLERSAAQIAAGNLEQRVAVERNDEIGSLATTFNDMAGSLQTSFQKLHRTAASFEQFVPGKFLSVIAPEGIENIKVGTSVSKEMTILFSDIRGYTTLSERSTPEQMFVFLNDYLPRIGHAISSNGGFIDKYIGDAVMALFDDTHTDGALRAAAAMRDALATFNAERSARNEPAVDIGIGMHRGPVVMGTVGFHSKIESTVIGDAVNLASRMEGLTKNYGVSILVTAAVVHSLVQREDFDLREVDANVAVKGKDEPIAVWELASVRKARTPG